MNRNEFDEVEKQVRSIFKKLHGKYEHTPVLLLSGLAEGADRVAVRAAVAEKVSYVAVLPMPEEVYIGDFATEHSRTEFKHMLRGAARTIVLPIHHTATIDDICIEGAARDKQYEMLGEFLVRYSQILVAVWDGIKNGPAGGTSDVVAMKLREKAVGHMWLSRVNSNGAGPLYEISATRQNSGNRPPSNACRELYPEGTNEKQYNESYKLQDRFNGDIKACGKDILPEARASRTKLFDGGEAVALTDGMEWVAKAYSCADAMAIHFARVSLFLWKIVFGLLGCAGVALTWLHTLEGGRSALYVYYACVVTAGLVARFGITTKRRERHEDYRALAEALRVQFFWMATGLPDLAADHYLRKQANETVWIRDAMSECGLYADFFHRRAKVQDEVPLRTGLAQTWVVSQAKYFTRRRDEYKRKGMILSSLAWASVAIGLTVPLLGLLPALQSKYEAWTHAVSAIGMWFAALLWNYIERRGFSQQARRYDLMVGLFNAANSDIGKLTREGKFQAVEDTIRELGCEALAENGDWLATHRDRELTAQLVAG